jgi:hypothetical protein
MLVSGQEEVQRLRATREAVFILEQVAFKAETFQIDKDRDRLRTHLSDAPGYLVWQECRPQGKVGERQEPFL